MSESNEKLIVDIDLQESDIQRANLWFLLSKWSTRGLLVLPLFGLLLLPKILLTKITPNGALALFALIVFPILYPVLIWFQTKRGFANLQGFQKKVQYELSAGGYDVNDIKSSAHVSWDTILRAAESKHSFHLFFHKSFFHTIPKRCIKRPEDVDRLRAILKHSLGARAKVST
jgi:hypothetical protein